MVPTSMKVPRRQDEVCSVESWSVLNSLGSCGSDENVISALAIHPSSHARDNHDDDDDDDEDERVYDKTEIGGNKDDTTDRNENLEFRVLFQIIREQQRALAEKDAKLNVIRSEHEEQQSKLIDALTAETKRSTNQTTITSTSMSSSDLSPSPLPLPPPTMMTTTESSRDSSCRRRRCRRSFCHDEECQADENGHFSRIVHDLRMESENLRTHCIQMMEKVEMLQDNVERNSSIGMYIDTAGEANNAGTTCSEETQEFHKDDAENRLMSVRLSEIQKKRACELRNDHVFAHGEIAYLQEENEELVRKVHELQRVIQKKDAHIARTEFRLEDMEQEIEHIRHVHAGELEVLKAFEREVASHVISDFSDEDVEILSVSDAGTCSLRDENATSSNTVHDVLERTPDSNETHITEIQFRSQEKGQDGSEEKEEEMDHLRHFHELAITYPEPLLEEEVECITNQEATDEVQLSVLRKVSRALSNDFQEAMESNNEKKFQLVHSVHERGDEVNCLKHGAAQESSDSLVHHEVVTGKDIVELKSFEDEQIDKTANSCHRIDCCNKIADEEGSSESEIVKESEEKLSNCDQESRKLQSESIEAKLRIYEDSLEIQALQAAVRIKDEEIALFQQRLNGCLSELAKAEDVNCSLRDEMSQYLCGIDVLAAELAEKQEELRQTRQSEFCTPPRRSC